ncbi:hypothetical protein IW140_000619 [Coemansia sp. RSA 1813]|nr:hypothetical protein EV178_003324 [Coemansia sp. RSA 1646]KAJ1774088.1 hypothetical protein LPJ74_000187 [Coemansia sp. RSA 1843]KAJ2092521.1 hypothetical protein IW138_000959 [Coemansia sp. RSA 986]KAJ2216784.1 hypothetical protein EV179_001074 [Coemansia sp. RSA 487]KAJ2572856.1 hypothetical protein IW140_000619 [Coemansia sp. RSA 1813]
MKLITTVAAAAMMSGVMGTTGAGGLASVDVNEACANSCQSASETQRDTCMQMCRQFAEKGVQFVPASTTHGAMTITVTATSGRQSTSAATPVHPVAENSAMKAESSAASPDTTEGHSDKNRLKDEDNDEDEVSGGSSSSSFSMMSSAMATRLSSAALLLGLSCAAFF